MGGVPKDSGLDITGTGVGRNIILVQEGALIVGRVDADNDGAVTTADFAAFAIAIDQSGLVSIAQYLSLEQLTPGNGSGDSHDEPIALTNGAVQVTVTITDGDGDTDTSTTSVGAQIKFDDDGPVETTATTTGTVEEEELANGNEDRGDGPGLDVFSKFGECESNRHNLMSGPLRCGGFSALKDRPCQS